MLATSDSIWHDTATVPGRMPSIAFSLPATGTLCPLRRSHTPSGLVVEITRTCVPSASPSRSASRAFISTAFSLKIDDSQ